MSVDDQPSTDVSTAERRAVEEWDETALGMWIARRYYLAEQSKVQIAGALGISRFQVARLLTEARRRGIVRIEIGTPGRLDRELSAALQTRLGIPRAIVIESQPDSAASSLRHIGAALADLLTEVVGEGDRVGLAWSRAIDQLAGGLRKLPPCDVVQLSGALSLPAEHQGLVEIVRHVAGLSGGTAYPIYAPVVVDDAGTGRGLRRQPEIASVLERADDLDIAVVSVGAWRPSASTVYDALDAPSRQRASAAGACGEVLGRLFDSGGNPITGPIDDRVLSASREQLRGVPERIATSYGAYRAEATLAAVRAGYVSTLVTDDELARAVLG